MKILLASTGGGGGNILRSIKALFRQDLALVQKTDSRYAERLRRALTARFLDTNEFSLTDVPVDERLLIGAQTTRRLGSRHNPDVAREALEESRPAVTALFRDYSVIVLIGTGGKGTGAGTMFPLAHLAREQRKLVIPIFVRPSFEWHEVDKRRYDHSLQVIDQFDSAQIRLIEILNDRGYSQTSRASQAIVWERMNVPIARGLRGLLYVLSDLSQVDPSDLCTLCAGRGRLRIGFGELDPASGSDPTDSQIEEASRRCWDNSYYAFTKPVGTSLVCIQGDWSNIVDGTIKRRLGTWAAGEAETSVYNPLYARPARTPRPWGVTALFAEHTGVHAPLEVDWPLDSRVPLPSTVQTIARERVPAVSEVGVAADKPRPVAVIADEPLAISFRTFRELCLAVNRREAAALAIAGNGATSEISLNSDEARKLLGTVWFRSVFTQLSEGWRERILDTLLQSSPIPDHVVRMGRRNVQVTELNYEELKALVTGTILPDAVRSDLQLLVAVGALWGADAIKKFAFAPTAPRESPGRRFSLAAFNPEP